MAEDIVLASRSPRRVQLLAELGIEPVVDPADVDETPRQNEDPVAYVRRVAADKARRVAQRHSGATVIAADTTVDIDGRILGQPLDIEDARTMLRTLSARTHRVHTAVVVIDAQSERADVVTSLVTFLPLDDEIQRGLDDRVDVRKFVLAGPRSEKIRQRRLGGCFRLGGIGCIGSARAEHRDTGCSEEWEHTSGAQC